MYIYYNVYSVLGIAFHCVDLCIVWVQVWIVLQQPGVKPIAAKKCIFYAKYAFAKLTIVRCSNANRL